VAAGLYQNSAERTSVRSPGLPRARLQLQSWVVERIFRIRLKGPFMSEKFSENLAQSRWIRLTQNIYFLQERDKSAQPVRKLAQSCLTHKMVLLLFILFMFAGHTMLWVNDIQCYGKRLY